MGLQRHLSPAVRMILRNTASQPIRTSLAVLGVSLAVAILVIGLFFIDAIEGLLHIQFDVTQRQDVTLAFTEPVSARATFELERLPGVTQIEASRIRAGRNRHGYIFRRAAVSGLDPIRN
jgi:putative ABC transport system permease protein